MLSLAARYSLMLYLNLLEGRVQLRFFHSSTASLQCSNHQHALREEYLTCDVDSIGRRLWETSDARVSQKFCADHHLYFNSWEDY